MIEKNCMHGTKLCEISVTHPASCYPRLVLPYITSWNAFEYKEMCQNQSGSFPDIREPMCERRKKRGEKFATSGLLLHLHTSPALALVPASRPSHQEYVLGIKCYLHPTGRKWKKLSEACNSDRRNLYSSFQLFNWRSIVCENGDNETATIKPFLHASLDFLVKTYLELTWQALQGYHWVRNPWA